MEADLWLALQFSNGSLHFDYIYLILRGYKKNVII